MNGTPKDIDPASELREDEEESSLPELGFERRRRPARWPPAAPRSLRAVKHAPPRPGVYRMVDGKGEVLYVGKAKNIKKRVTSYTRPTGHDSRIVRMISGTVTMEFVTTKTETEALLLEANLIKRLRPRFNVLLRDDKSFPFILITSDHWAPQILKHRGARTRPGTLLRAVRQCRRGQPHHQCACSARSCCAPARIRFSRRARGPACSIRSSAARRPARRRSISPAIANWCARPTNFSPAAARLVQKELATEMDTASTALDFERAAIYRDRLAALSAITSHQGINPRTLEEADVFAVHQAGGYTCVEVFFFRTGQNWGNRAYFPKADRALGAAEVLSAFLAQFYDDKPPPRLVLVSHEFEERALLAEALTTKSGRKVEVGVPQRGERKELVQHALANAREALARKLADTSSQQKLLKALTETFALPREPRRIEVYDNSHIAGSNPVGAMVVAGPEGFRKNQYRKFNIRSQDLKPGDDYGMLREVLQRRFKRLLAEAPRTSLDDALAAEQSGAVDIDDEQPWPDLVLIDGGQGQLNAATETLAAMGVTDVPMVAIAKGPDRDAGRETFFMAGRNPFKLPPRDPLLYFIERLRDEAHRFAIGSHRTRRKKDIREAGLQEIPGIGPTRKRALLRHFGTVKAIERASLPDLSQVPGINAETARKIYEFFHEQRRSRSPKSREAIFG